MSKITHHLIVFILVFSLILPHSAAAATRSELLAQIAQLQALITQLLELKATQQFQKDNKGAAVADCVYITKNILPGYTDERTGGDITKLQWYFHEPADKYPKVEVSGIYDSATRDAVISLQTQSGIITERNDPEYGIVLDKTRTLLSADCGRESGKFIGSRGEPIATIISPNNGGTLSYQNELIVYAHVYNTNDSGGKLLLDAVGGHFGDSVYMMMSQEIEPNFAGVMKFVVPDRNKNMLRPGYEYDLRVRAYDNNFGSHIHNHDHTDKPLSFTGNKNTPKTLTLEEKNPCLTTKSVCGTDVIPLDNPVVEQIGKPRAVITADGFSGLYKFIAEITAPEDFPIYIPVAEAFTTMHPMESGGVTFGGKKSMNEVTDTNNTSEVQRNGSRYYQIDAGETAVFSIQVTFTPFYRGEFAGELFAFYYEIDAYDTVISVAPEDKKRTDYIFIDGKQAPPNPLEPKG